MNAGETGDERGSKDADFPIYFTGIFSDLCRFSEFFKTAFKFHSDIYVIQSDHVDHLDSVGISGSRHHGGGGGSRRYECAVFFDFEENSCDQGGG